MIEDKIDQYLNESKSNSKNLSLRTLMQKINFKEEAECCNNCEHYNKIDSLCMSDDVSEFMELFDMTFFSTEDYSSCKYFKKM